MKTLLILILLSAQASELIDLGTITPRRGVILVKNTDRSDWSHFQAEFLSLAPSSNQVTLSLTNELLTVSSLGALPSGPAIMGLWSVCADESVSTTNYFKLDVRRSGPPAPGARGIQLLSDANAAPTIQQAMERQRKSREVSPPIPSQTNGPVTLELPNGRAKTYGEHLDEVTDERRGKR